MNRIVGLDMEGTQAMEMDDFIDGRDPHLVVTTKLKEKLTPIAACFGRSTIAELNSIMA